MCLRVSHFDHISYIVFILMSFDFDLLWRGDKASVASGRAQITRFVSTFFKVKPDAKRMSAVSLAGFDHWMICQQQHVLMRAGAENADGSSQLNICGDEKQATEVGQLTAQKDDQSYCICHNTTKVGHWPL